MEKITQTFATKISLFQNRLQSFLENETHVKQEELDLLRHNFESTQDSALVRGLSQGLPDDHIDRAIIVFSRLAMFFEGGILLENNDGKWKPQAFFNHGITELIKNFKPTENSPTKKIKKYSKTSPENQFSINIPQINMLTILKTDSAVILEKLGMQHLDPEKKTSCLLIKVTPDFAFLLFSILPDLWLKDHIENVRKALINGFAD